MLVHKPMADIEIFIDENISEVRKASEINDWSEVREAAVNGSEIPIFDGAEEQGHLSDFGFDVAAVCLFLIFLLGSTTNLLVIAVVCRNKKLRTPMNVVLVNLSVSDFTISVLGTPLSFMSAVYKRWIFGEKMCKAYAFMMTLSGMTSIGTLTAIAIERYVIISKPYHGSNRLTPSSTAVILILIWTYSLAQALPPLFGWNEYVLEEPGIACSVQWQALDLNHTSYVVYIFVLGYVLPVGIMANCYIKIVLIIKSAPRPMGKGSTAKAEYKVTVMAWAMVVCTVTAWTPYAAVSLTVALGFQELVTPAASACPAIFAKCSVICNPIVYFFLNSQIREALFEYFPQRGLQGRQNVELSLETIRKTGFNNTVFSTSSKQKQLEAGAVV